jgi:ribosomal protein S18 acetylase RimI-like enzyme
MATNIITLTFPEIAARQAQIVDVYRSAFMPLPYNKPEAEIAEFAGSFLNQFDRDAYRFVAALESHSKRLVGFAYGYSSRAGRWWYEHASRMLPELAGTVWLEDSFQLVEIALDPQFQGQGIGGQLHDHLLVGIQHGCAILATLQAETAAFRLYRSRGWVVLGENLLFPGIPRRYQIMGLEMSPG